MNPLFQESGGDGTPDVAPIIEDGHGDNEDFTQIAAIAQPKENDIGERAKSSYLQVQDDSKK